MAGHCNSSEFRCNNDRCIPEEVKCDDLDNCGDWSDERASTCGWRESITAPFFSMKCDNFTSMTNACTGRHRSRVCVLPLAAVATIVAVSVTASLCCAACFGAAIYCFCDRANRADRQRARRSRRNVHDTAVRQSLYNVAQDVV